MDNEKKVLISVSRLTKHFKVRGGGVGKKPVVKAVDDVSIDIYRGETLGLVGESGCGKTTLGRTIIRLYEPTSGRIVYDGTPIYDSDSNVKVKMLNYRRKMQIIFQDPSASLDPRMTVGEIVGEAIDIHKLASGKAERTEMIKSLLDEVGLNTEHANRFPHEFSGGQQQRGGIARALAVSPEFIVCDEPISALDVSIQAQIVNMLEDLQREKGLTYLFIAHDISVVRHISNRIGVMYLGNMVELAPSNEIYTNPIHPYTRTLMSAVPLPDPDKSRARKRILLEGDIPSPINPPPGCRFSTRCPYAEERCNEEKPEFADCGGGHYCACHAISEGRL